MSDQLNTDDVSRRSVLRTGALATGTALLGSATVAGNAAASPRANYAYVADSVTEGEYTLATREGRSQPGCGGPRPRCVKFEAEDGTTFHTIPSSYEEGDTVRVGDEIANCPSDLHEVALELVED